MRAILVLCLVFSTAAPLFAEEGMPGVRVAEGVAARRKAKRKQWEKERKKQATKKPAAKEAPKPEEPAEADLEAELDAGAPSRDAAEKRLESDLEGASGETGSADSAGEAEAATGPRGRSLSSLQRDRSRFPWKLGLAGSFDGALAGVPDAGGSSSGFGFGGGFNVSGVLGRRILLTFGLGYQRTRLTRSVDGTGIMGDTDPAQFAQTEQFLSATLLVGYLLGEPGRPKDPIFWIEGGTEFLYGLSASQQSNIQSEVSYTGQRMLLALLGPGGSIEIAKKLSLMGGLYGFYHLTKATGTSLYGARIKLGLQLAI